MRMICGPATSIGELRRIVDTAAQGKHGRATIFFYSSAGKGKMLVVKSVPHAAGDRVSLSMHQSDAISLKDAYFGEDTARAIVCGECPNKIEHVNQRFTTEFKVSEEWVTGKTLRMLHGPQTDVLGFKNLITEAEGGRIQRGVFQMYTSECQELQCEVKVTPLLGSSSTISKFLVAFSPKCAEAEESPESSCSLDFDSSSASVPSHPVDALVPASSEMLFLDPFTTLNNATLAATTRPLFPGVSSSDVPTASSSLPTAYAMWSTPTPTAYTEFQTPVSDSVVHVPGSAGPATDSFATELATLVAGHSFSSAVSDPTPSFSTRRSSRAPEQQQQQQQVAAPVPTLKLVPRKKRPGCDVGPDVLELTAARLQEMEGMSMKQAANTLGIAASTLKKACRKLGVERWPHLKDGMKGKAMDYDGSYVRRLYAKYSGRGVERSGSGDVGGEGSFVEEWSSDEEALLSTSSLAVTMSSTSSLAVTMSSTSSLATMCSSSSFSHSIATPLCSTASLSASQAALPPGVQSPLPAVPLPLAGQDALAPPPSRSSSTLEHHPSLSFTPFDFQGAHSVEVLHQFSAMHEPASSDLDPSHHSHHNSQHAHAACSGMQTDAGSSAARGMPSVSEYQPANTQSWAGAAVGGASYSWGAAGGQPMTQENVDLDLGMGNPDDEGMMMADVCALFDAAVEGLDGA
eukprot:CAMPEP_0181304738 /NCGR_PEP_ID=MMETSP1101-20121128/9322_1 /TAXON_ID=46948 /ORGANISM="Rhodomonas abbreviata, Strain Caron Lab Isolate" /LENGTH=686 /DNA_ID=CAMNT_0023410539 /DNA_START=317 /DNA_END=2374 /DNA_ORIENTATION=-